MDKIVIEGGKSLRGEVKISGAKNAALPILAACLLADGECVIENVPKLRDITTMVRILKALGAKAYQTNDKVIVNSKCSLKDLAPYSLVSTMRASICVLGPLLARLGKAQVSMPGGCIIGPRPIDLHIKGLAALGANMKIEHGYIKATADRLKGNDVFLGGAFGSSVLATANVMMAAVCAKGKTLIENAACEPELEDLANFLNKMGAKIRGAGSHLIQIEGVKKLRGVRHKIIPDRIETGTYIMAASMTKGDVLLKEAKPLHLNCVMDKLKDSGVKFRRTKSTVRVKGARKLRPVDVTTLPYPGFPTDLQAQMMAVMSVTPGISVITEKIYPDRFIHISELNRMGSKIFLEGSSAIVNGVKELSGAPVMASDLRASAALVIAGLVANGRTEVHRVYHLDRGYECLEEKFSNLGAKIWREKE